MMAAVVPGMISPASKIEERQRILSELLAAVKECQVRFGGRAELAAESDKRVSVLCSLLEAALSHGLRLKPLLKSSSTIRVVTEIVSSSLHLSRTNTQDNIVFWHFVREHLTRHEYERYLVLKQVWTDSGRGRAWLRSSLNERSLERYLHCFLGIPELITVFYEDWAFLVDQERSSMLTTMAAGLGSILFAISIDNVDLNQPNMQRDGQEPVLSKLTQSEPVITSSVADPCAKRRAEHKRRKRVPANIISFDDDGLSSQICSAGSQTSSSSAPPTCLNSPCFEQVPSVQPDPQEPQQPLLRSHHLVSSNSDSTQRPNELQLTDPVVHVDSSLLTKTESPECISVQRRKRESRTEQETLTPVNDVGVGELIPVGLMDETHSEEDSISVPSYSEDIDCAAAILLTTQKPVDIISSECCCSLVSKRPVNHFNHVNGDVSETVRTLMAQKEKLIGESHSLHHLLGKATDKVTELSSELDRTSIQHKERVDRLESRIQALLRENELLKHQLRKYVGAVQMLKRDGTQAHETLTHLEAANQHTVPDYHHEAQEYEKKLIQVAEMHGELMEFNDRLVRLLQLKEASLHLLRDELVQLRGPLPDDGTSDDDTASLVSDPGSVVSPQVRTLINIWIPSAFLTGGQTDVHHVYQVFVRIRDDEWNIYRRYSQFYNLNKELKKKNTSVATLDFPPKKTLGNKDAGFVEERRRKLQHYLRCMVNHIGYIHAELATAPDKKLLVSVIPFFGETCDVEEKGHRKRASSRNPFSRLSRNVDSNQTMQHSPHYTGL